MTVDTEQGTELPQQRSQTEPTAPPLSVSVEVDHTDRVAYALAHNRVPIIKTVAITNTGLSDIVGVKVTVSSRWALDQRGPLREHTFTIDRLAAGHRTIIDATECRLDDVALAQLDEEIPARLVVTVTNEDGAAHVKESDWSVLARNQWIWEFPEYTAAFVQPNHPVVTSVIADAAEHLRRATGDPSINGYQSYGRERPIAIAKAIFEALKSHIDLYIEPPASFGIDGQKVRPLDQVLEERQGTCIDLACAYASCLEQAGISPVIILVHGHAFTAFYTEDPGPHNENGLQARLVQDFAEVVNLIERGLLIPVETVALTSARSFEHARGSADTHFAERRAGCSRCEELAAKGARPDQLPHFRAAVDVHFCHRDQILPLPARTVQDGVITLVIDNGPVAGAIVERRDAVTHKLLPQSVPARVQQWKKNLLDLSMNNRLLNFRPLRTGLCLVPPKGLLGDIEDQLVAGAAIELRELEGIAALHESHGFRAVRDNLSDEATKHWSASRVLGAYIDTPDLLKRVKSLVSKAKLEEQETGVNNLHLALGSLRWPATGTKAGVVTSPIFLVPIRITLRRGSQAASMSIDPGAMTSVNYCLIEALRGKHGMELSWFREDMRDDSGLDVLAGMDRLRQEIQEKGLTVQGFDVVDDASIGILRFNKVRLWKDLDEHWQDFAGNSVVAHLIQGMGGRFTDPAETPDEATEPLDDTTLLNPQPADGAQSKAILAALRGRSFVLEGPPGTGKSQTITNLLANALTRGKKVLFVAEKQPALAVVKERLKQVGLDPYCLDLHDKGSTPEAIKTQLREALDHTPTMSQEQWQRLEATFATTAQQLQAYRERLHDTSMQGLSYFDAFRGLLDLGDGVAADLSRAVLRVDLADLASIRQCLREIEPVALAAQPRQGHPWAMASSIDFAQIDRGSLAEASRHVANAYESLAPSKEPWAVAVLAATTIEDLGSVLTFMAASAARLDLSLAASAERATPAWSQQAQAVLDHMEQTLGSAQAILPTLRAEHLTLDLATIAERAGIAARSLFIGRKRRVAEALGSLAAEPLLAAASPAQAAQVVNDLANTVAKYSDGTQDLSRRLAGFASLIGMPFMPVDFDSARGTITAISRGSALLSANDPCGQALSQATSFGMPSAEANLAAATLHESLIRMAEITSATPSSWADWFAGRSLGDAVSQSLSTWTKGAEDSVFLALNRWLALLAHIEVLNIDSTRAFRSQLLAGAIPPNEASDAFERGLLSRLIEVVGEEHQFDIFDSEAQNRLVSKFVSLLNDRETSLRQVIPATLAGNRGIDTSSSVGAVGQLRTELGMKRRGARSVRDLLSKYPDLITTLTPCFLMSPDSVAKFLVPGKVTFDIVVFDEASQIPVADAIGAMGRAKSVIIVGDSKQMPPSTAFGASPIRGSDEDEQGAGVDAVPEDAESILEECVESGLSREMLTWHYRSRDEVLIDFSNRNYYEGRLASFPAPSRKGRPDTGLVYRKVDGQFDHGGTRTNVIEAEHIVAEIRRRAHDPLLSQFSMGVVTLNKEQQEVVTGMLKELRDPEVDKRLEADDVDEPLFVLPLEMVQGRERDVIILGTSFSRRAGTDKMPLNFGPLNLARGERRLNVAITRARRQVVIFSSFPVEDLVPAQAQGLKHLHEYLLKARQVTEDREAFYQGGRHYESAYATQIADRLRAEGLTVTAGYGLSHFKVDLAVSTPEHPDQWLVGVLLDGDEWASRDLVLDREALPANVLERMMQWPAIARVWLPAWQRDADDVVAEIKSLVHRVASGEHEPVPAPPAEPEPRHTSAEVPSSSRTDETSADVASALSAGAAAAASPLDTPSTNRWARGARPYTAPSVGFLGLTDELDSPHRGMTTHLREIADKFGPLPADDALRLMANGYGLSRVRESRLETLRVALPSDQRVSTPFGDFLFPASVLSSGAVTPAFDWYRQSTSTERAVTQIAPHEIANLCVDLVASCHSIEVEELASEVLGFFGYGRKTKETLATAQELVRWAVQQGRLRLDGSTIRPIAE